MKTGFDAFDTHFAPLTAANLDSALLASATLPLIMQPVAGIPAAPPGAYWDGGLIDYHLAFPYSHLARESESDLVCIRILRPRSCRGGWTRRCRGATLRRRASKTGTTTSCWSRPRRHFDTRCRARNCRIGKTSITTASTTTGAS